MLQVTLILATSGSCLADLKVLRISRAVPLGRRRVQAQMRWTTQVFTIGFAETDPMASGTPLSASTQTNRTSSAPWFASSLQISSQNVAPPAWPIQYSQHALKSVGTDGHRLVGRVHYFIRVDADGSGQELEPEDCDLAK